LASVADSDQERAHAAAKTRTAPRSDPAIFYLACMPLEMTCPICNAGYYTAASTAPAQACECCGGDLVLLPGTPEEQLAAGSDRFGGDRRQSAANSGREGERQQGAGFLDAV